jgi:hypothetical protein
MMTFKFFHGYDVYHSLGELRNNRRENFERLMDMLHEVDAMVEPNRNNYEILDDWDVTLFDGLGEE